MEAHHARPSKSVEAATSITTMTSMQTNNYVAAPGAARTRMHAWACVCAFIASDVLRTVKGDYGSSG